MSTKLSAFILLISLFVMSSAYAKRSDFSAQIESSFTECYSNGEDVLSESVFKSDSTWTHVFTAFEDDHCKKAYLYFTKIFSVKLSDKNLDLVLQSVLYTPLTNETVDALNLQSWCGFNDWKVNSAKEVTGLFCGDYQAPKVNDTIYTIFSTKTENNKKLWTWGVPTDAHSGKSSNQRHNILSNYWFTISE